MSISEQVNELRVFGAMSVIELIEPNILRKQLNQAADTIESLSAKLEEPKWIPCSEHLPKDKKTVLICGDAGWIKTGWYESGRWWTGFSLANIEDGVTSWQPLPEPYRP